MTSHPGYRYRMKPAGQILGLGELYLIQGISIAQENALW
jgi:hypothetical protein